MKYKKISFVIFLVVGNVVSGIPILYYLGIDAMFKFIAIFTSLSTAGYSILNEPEKPQPLLRVAPKIRTGYGMGSLGFGLDIDNIGDGIAKNIKITCKTGSKELTLENNGVYTLKVLPPKELPTKVIVITSIDRSTLLKQIMDVEMTYSNMDNKQKPSLKESYKINDLLDNLKKEALSKEIR